MTAIFTRVWGGKQAVQVKCQFWHRNKLAYTVWINVFWKLHGVLSAGVFFLILGHVCCGNTKENCVLYWAWALYERCHLASRSPSDSHQQPLSDTDCFSRITIIFLKVQIPTETNLCIKNVFRWLIRWWFLISWGCFECRCMRGCQERGQGRSPAEEMQQISWRRTAIKQVTASDLLMGKIAERPVGSLSFFLQTLVEKLPVPWGILQCGNNLSFSCLEGPSLRFVIFPSLPSRSLKATHFSGAGSWASLAFSSWPQIVFTIAV